MCVALRATEYLWRKFGTGVQCAFFGGGGGGEGRGSGGAYRVCTTSECVCVCFPKLRRVLTWCVYMKYYAADLLALAASNGI